jgi:hypothetical protein
VLRGKRNGSPTTVNLRFLDLTHYSGTLVAPGIEPGTSGSVERDSDHRPQRHMTFSPAYLCKIWNITITFADTAHRVSSLRSVVFNKCIS